MTVSLMTISLTPITCALRAHIYTYSLTYHFTYVLIIPISCALRSQEIDIIRPYFSIPTVCALRAHTCTVANPPNPRLTYRIVTLTLPLNLNPTLL
jgi:H+/gluconate symporter-like permease